MNDVQLKYVVKAVEAGSFAKVAEYYHTSYQAISYQIDSLESEFGVTIFKRSNKGCELTAEGTLIYQFAKNTLDNYTSLLRNVKTLEDIRIGIDLRHIPPDLLEYISSDCPLSISLIPINYDNMLEEQASGSIDCYLGYKRGMNSKLSFIPLFGDSIGVAVSSVSKLSEKNCIMCADIVGNKIHIGKFDWTHRNDLILELKRYDPSCEIIEDSVESLAIAEIYSGQAFGILPCGYSFIFNDSVKVVPLKDESIEYGIYYLTEQNKANNLKKAITTFLQQQNTNQ